jgi:hypothetical protein
MMDGNTSFKDLHELIFNRCTFGILCYFSRPSPAFNCRNISADTIARIKSVDGRCCVARQRNRPPQWYLQGKSTSGTRFEVLAHRNIAT